MDKILRILRQKDRNSGAYWEEHAFETESETATVATALASVSECSRLSAENDEPYRPLIWQNSCLQKKCGACAMVVNGMPCLACDTFIKDCRNEKVTIEPLKKFPVIADLTVDRSIMMDNLKRLEAWLEEGADIKDTDTVFEASACLQCGLCLEICPNFYTGGEFAGMAAMTSQARLLSEESASQHARTSKHYIKSVYNGCGKSLACRDICPAGIDIDKLLVRSNAAAVWKRWKRS